MNKAKLIDQKQIFNTMDEAKGSKILLERNVYKIVVGDTI